MIMLEIDRDKPVFYFGIGYLNKRITLFIVDLYDEANPTRTVTNAVEHVLEIIFKNWPKELTAENMPSFVVCRDSCGDWAEIILDEEMNFLTFAAIPEQTKLTLNECYIELAKNNWG